MRINRRNYYGFGLGAVILMSATAGLILSKHDNTQNKNYDKRIQNMEYVKHNAPDRYVSTLETVNKSKSSRIIPENINAIWDSTASKVRDSLEVVAKKIKP